MLFVADSIMDALGGVFDEVKVLFHNLDIVQCVLGAIAALLLYYWHKTKKPIPPGPYGLPLVGYLPFLGEDASKTFAELGKKYGSIFSLRLGRNLLIVLNDYEAVKQAYFNPKSLDRAPVFAFLKHVGFSGHSGEEWSEQKRISLQFAKEISLGSAEWECLIQDELQRFVDQIRSYEGKPVKIDKALKTFLVNNILSLLIGRPLKDHREDMITSEYVNIALTEGEVHSYTTQMPRLMSWLSYLKVHNVEKAKFVEDFLDFMRVQIDEHEKGTETKDIKDYINLYLEKMKQMKKLQKKHFFTDDNLLGNLNSLFVGSVDTVHSTMTWLFRLMIKYPDVQMRVQKELDEFFAEEERVSYNKRKQIPYTVAVIMETLRYSSIVPMSTGRCAVSDFQVMGYTIPKGCQLAAHLKALHFDPNYWSEPLSFKPERFLRDGGRTCETNPESFAPFSLGRRNCPGEKIAWMELVNFFPVLLHRFAIRLPDGERLQFKVVRGLLERLEPQELIFEERNKA